MSFFSATIPTTLASKTLILPIVSVANLPQLSCDLLISSLTLERIGILDAKHLMPVVGGRENGNDAIAEAVYGKEGLDVVVIQQRSPVLKSSKEEFIAELVEWIHKTEFTSLLILTGADVTNRTDSQMHTPVYHLHPNALPSLTGSPLANLLTICPPYKAPTPSSDHFIPGGGLTRRLLAAVAESKTKVPVAVIVQFVLEGDNSADAKLMSNTISQVLGLGINEWREPQSWKQGLFGAPHDQTLFG